MTAATPAAEESAAAELAVEAVIDESTVDAGPDADADLDAEALDAEALDAEAAVQAEPVYFGSDTVSRAASTPNEDQPYQELGLRDDEYARIRQILGRRPTRAELAMYSIMWSEHCSYKSSKVHLRQFIEKKPQSDRMLAGIGENAGVIRVSDELAVTFKVESHNHPSFVEPYQGAATGVGGALRRRRPRGHPARPAGCRRWHRRVRKLARPAQHRR
jgi:phosphoribosylformylglycinamidine synthase subunit PurL